MCSFDCLLDLIFVSDGSKVGKNCHTLLTTDGPPIFMFSLLQRQSNALRSLVLKTLVFLARHSVNLTDSERYKTNIVVLLFDKAYYFVHRNQLRLSDHTALGLASMWSSAEKEPPSLEVCHTLDLLFVSLIHFFLSFVFVLIFS